MDAAVPPETNQPIGDARMDIYWEIDMQGAKPVAVGTFVNLCNEVSKEDVNKTLEKYCRYVAKRSGSKKKLKNFDFILRNQPENCGIDKLSADGRGKAWFLRWFLVWSLRTDNGSDELVVTAFPHKEFGCDGPKADQTVGSKKHLMDVCATVVAEQIAAQLGRNITAVHVGIQDGALLHEKK